MAASSLASSRRLSSSVKNKRCVEEAGIGREPPEEIVERLIALHRLGQRRAGRGPPGERRQLAFVGLLEREAFGSTAIEIALYLRIIDAGIEIAEIPFRQGAKAACGTRLGCAMSGGTFCWGGHNRCEGARTTTSLARNARETGAWMARRRCIWREIAAGQPQCDSFVVPLPDVSPRPTRLMP